jgi:hypothetical protein
MKDKINERNRDDVRVEGLRIECITNREGVRYSDNVCVMIMGFLLTATATLYTFGIGSIKSGKTGLIAIALITPIWFIGYLYLAEKRFIILRVAYYLKIVVEPNHPGFNWENFHHNLTNEERKVFHRFDPFYLESILSAIVIIGNPILFLYLDNYSIRNPITIGLFIITLLFLILVIREWRAYASCKKLMDTRTADSLITDAKE